jgi:hypothetical protein
VEGWFLSGSPAPTRRSSLGSTEVFVVVEAQVVENFDRFKQEIHKEKNQEMLDLRKTFLTFAAVGLVFAGAANAQVATLSSLTATGGTGYVAVEGTTEALPQIVVGFTPNTLVSSATLVLTSNVPLTTGANSSGGVDVTVSATSAVSSTVTTVTQSGTTLTVALSGLNTAASLDSITISGLRVNASLAPSSSQITLSATGVAGGGITGSIAATNVAFVLTSELIPNLTGAANQSLCSVSSSAVYPVVTTAVQENFPAAFKTKTQVTGFSTVSAAQGTVLAITFSNLVPGVSYYVPSSVTSASLTLTAYTAATGATPATPVTVGTTGGLVAVTVSGTSGTAYFGVTASNPGAIESASILLSENIPTPANVTAVSTTPVAASVSLVGVTSGVPQFAANSYAGTQKTVSGSNGLLTACQTTLLFPYATTLDGYDMGFSIANASSMPGTTSQQSGTCTVNFYGTGAPTTIFVTPAIKSGSLDTEILSNVAPGFQGYIVATCNFQHANGYAIISNGFATGTGGVSGNYLAIPQ